MNKQILAKFYSTRNNSVKTLEKHVLLERFITLSFLKKYVKPNSAIAEIGAGVRAYSPELVKFAKHVVAIDLFDENLTCLSKQIKHNNFYTLCANATDLGVIKSDCFDVVFVNGPLSHLFNKTERNKAIAEARRICKKGGLVLFNYLTNTPIIYRAGVIKGNIGATQNYNKRSEKDIYATYFVNDFHKLVSGAKLQHVCDISLDGLFEILKEYTNKLRDSDFSKIKQMQLQIATRPDMIGCASHVISVYKKN